MGLTVKDLEKSFGKQPVIRGLDLELQPATIYGLLGVNGAGKSTLMKLLTNRLVADSGSLLLDGQEVWSQSANLSQLYLVSDEDWLPKESLKKLFEKLAYFYGNFDWAQAEELCQTFRLDPSQKLSALSTGQRTMAKWVLAFCLPVSYIFLDEPLLGLDAGTRKLFKEALIKTYSHRPRTFVIASHLVQEISPLLERVLIMEEGRISEDGLTESFLNQFYSLTGPNSLLDDLCWDRQVLSRSQLGYLGEVLIRGQRPESLPEEIKLSPITLHDYMVYLTEKASDL